MGERSVGGTRRLEGPLGLPRKRDGYLMQEGVRYSQGFVQKLLLVLEFLLQTLHFDLQLNVLGENERIGTLEKKFINENNRNH